MASVRIEHARKRYGDVTVIPDLSLDIRDEEFMVLVGPSGCGKSTLLRMIAGLEEISGGTISIGDRVVNDLAPKERDIAMVFQNYALYPHMSVRDNLAFGLKMRKVAKAEREARVAEAADILGLGEYLDRKPRQLSGGQRQRVAVGRAIVRKPSVFLFDEPLSNLDAKLRVQMRAELVRLQAQLKTTTIYVTHDQIEAMTMGDRIAVMDEGTLQQVGRPLELYNHPVNRFVGTFLGTPAMNFVNATLVEGSLRASGFTMALPPHHPGIAGGPFVVGIRPEHIGPGGDGPPFPLVVEMVEPLGHEVVVHGRAGADRLVAKLAADHLPTVGSSVQLTVDSTHVHLFDARSGVRLDGGQGDG